MASELFMATSVIMSRERYGICAPAGSSKCVPRRIFRTLIAFYATSTALRISVPVPLTIRERCNAGLFAGALIRVTSRIAPWGLCRDAGEAL